MSDSLPEEIPDIEKPEEAPTNATDHANKEQEVLSTNDGKTTEPTTDTTQEVATTDTAEDVTTEEKVSLSEKSVANIAEEENVIKHKDTVLETSTQQETEQEVESSETSLLIKGKDETTSDVQTAEVAGATDKKHHTNEDQSAVQSITEKSMSIKSKDEETSSPQATQSTETPSSAAVPSKEDYADHVTYREDGTAIYTDPKTKYQYKWCTEANNWTSCEAQNTTTTTSDPYENEHYKWCQQTQKWIPKQTQVTETEHYKWDAAKNEWIPKVQKDSSTNSTDIVYDVDEDGQRTYTDKDGTTFFWDADKKAWFPKIDEDFMARYQMNYGFIDNTSASEKEKEQQELAEVKRKQEELQKLTEEARTNDEASKGAAAGVKRKAQQEPPKWFEVDPTRNTKVYVSNLPLDITLDEFAEIMGKCGMIMRDPLTQKFKLKLYTEADGQMKGDGLCDYIKVESVDLALNILDEYELRGNKIRVQRAQFQMRGEYNPALKPKRKKKDKEKLAKIKEKLFDWRPEKMRGERSKHEKTVIIKNLFHPELFEKEVQLILDYQNDLREECSKCGTVRKVVIYDRHSEGVAQVNMTSPEEADLVIQMMHGRYFGKRQLIADHWDGKTKYKVEETEEEIQKRLNKWDQYLETDEQKSLKLTNEQDVEKSKEPLEIVKDCNESTESTTSIEANVSA